MATTHRILLVEDDLGDSEYIQEILSQQQTHPFMLDAATTLKDATSRLSTGTYDVVLSDLTLPDSQGLETFASLQKVAEKTPIVVLTGLDDETIALEALRQGAQDYLVKGQFNKGFLDKTIQYAIERNKTRTELAAATEQLSQVNEQLDQLAHNDPLTCLLNRRGLDQVISREMAWAHRHASTTVVLIIDLDDFKKINDTLGHSAGDAVLKEMAFRIKEPLRATDVAARIGGDEFLVLLPDTETEEGAKIAEKLRSSIADKPFIVGQEQIKVTASVGAIPVVSPSLSIDDILTESHDALYKSKTLGKNRVSVDAKRSDHRRNDRSPSLLEVFLKKNQFHTLIQPIYNLVTDTIFGYEFFSRSSLPVLEKPEDFFRFGLENNLQSQIDLSCLAACLKSSSMLPPSAVRHINISPSTIVDIATSDVSKAFNGQHVDEKFCLEINQRQIIGDPSYLVHPLHVLRNAGFLIALENINYTQNALEAIILIKPDFLKIDRHFVKGISRDPARLRSVKRLVKMADSLGIEMMAPGVEVQTDLNALKLVGIKYGQGYLWSEPKLPSVQFSKMN